MHDHDHEHDHDHGACHDPNCHCHDHEHHHHDHDHDHEHHHHDHEHDHDHGECHDPNCHCHDHHHHDSPAARTAEGAFVMSCSRTFAGPIGAAALTERLKTVFLDLGDRAAVEGIIPGHIKAAVATADGVLGLSITRPGMVDLTPTGKWDPQATLTDYAIRINVMLLSDVGIREEDLFAGL